MSVDEVFVLYHSYEDKNETNKLIGIFASEKLARETIVKFQILPGFRDHLDGFSIERHLIDRVAWGEGFGIDEKYLD